jgi:hypothetical protein
MRLSRLDNDEEEDYDLSAMGISDGFRPAASAPLGHHRISSRASQPDSTGRRTPPPRPSSTTKPRGIDSFALRHDGAAGQSISRRPVPAATSSNDQMITRSSSVSTESPFVTADTPYQGPSAPSHPYHMYSQGTRPARTASVATASTFHPADRLYTGPVNPTHPYEMYPQAISGDMDTSETAAPIPVGFPGRRDDYQRQIGPEGEEAGDIIGPLGHTEQLPPYTQYPTEGFGKAQSVPAMAGAGGIGLATRNPEFSSREDLGSPASRQSVRSLTSDSEHQVNVAAIGQAEKPAEKKWKQIAQRKVWDIVPVWAFVLVGVVCLLFAIVLGGVLGVLSAKRHRPPPPFHGGGFV